MLLLSTSSLKGYSIHRILLFAKKAGYDGIDLNITNDDFDSWDALYLQSLIFDLQIPILSITAPSIGLNDKKLEEIAKIAEILKVQLITFYPPHFSDGSSNWFSKGLARLKKDSNISICVKNVEPKFIFFIIPKYRNATLNDIKSITGDTCLEVSSVESSSGLDILKAQKILGTSIKNVYISDRDGDKIGLIPGHAGGGTSYLPLESFLMKLKISLYNGFITFKVDPKELGVGNEEKIFTNLENFKNYYKKYYLDYK